MQTGLKKSPQGSKSMSGSINPFARALAETENSYSSPQKPMDAPLNPFSEALARAGGAFPQDTSKNTDWQEQQRALLEKQRNKEILRKKLHDQVNQIDMRAVYDAREKQVKREIDQLRAELKLLAKEVGAFHKEIEVTLHTEVGHPGQTGKYYLTFFRDLKNFIILLRQKIHSARTWATQFHAKQKKKQRGSAGLQIAGQQHEQTKTVYDMMHHERSSTYSGG